MKYRITGTDIDLTNGDVLIVTAVQISSVDNKEETAKVKDDDLERFLGIFGVPHYDHLVGKEIDNDRDATLQDSVNALLIID